jgi:hypothetical protein
MAQFWRENQLIRTKKKSENGFGESRCKLGSQLEVGEPWSNSRIQCVFLASNESKLVPRDLNPGPPPYDSKVKPN